MSSQASAWPPGPSMPGPVDPLNDGDGDGDERVFTDTLDNNDVLVAALGLASTTQLNATAAGGGGSSGDLTAALLLDASLPPSLAATPTKPASPDRPPQAAASSPAGRNGRSAEVVSAGPAVASSAVAASPAPAGPTPLLEASLASASTSTTSFAFFSARDMESELEQQQQQQQQQRSQQQQTTTSSSRRSTTTTTTTTTTTKTSVATSKSASSATTTAAEHELSSASSPMALLDMSAARHSPSAAGAGHPLAATSGFLSRFLTDDLGASMLPDSPLATSLGDITISGATPRAGAGTAGRWSDTTGADLELGASLLASDSDSSPAPSPAHPPPADSGAAGSRMAEIKARLASVKQRSSASSAATAQAPSPARASELWAHDSSNNNNSHHDPDSIFGGGGGGGGGGITDSPSASARDDSLLGDDPFADMPAMDTSGFDQNFDFQAQLAADEAAVAQERDALGLSADALVSSLSPSKLRHQSPRSNNESPGAYFGPRSNALGRLGPKTPSSSLGNSKDSAQTPGARRPYFADSSDGKTDTPPPTSAVPLYVPTPHSNLAKSDGATSVASKSVTFASHVTSTSPSSTPMRASSRSTKSFGASTASSASLGTPKSEWGASVGPLAVDELIAGLPPTQRDNLFAPPSPKRTPQQPAAEDVSDRDREEMATLQRRLDEFARSDRALNRELGLDTHEDEHEGGEDEDEHEHEHEHEGNEGEEGERTTMAKDTPDAGPTRSPAAARSPPRHTPARTPMHEQTLGLDSFLADDDPLADISRMVFQGLPSQVPPKMKMDVSVLPSEEELARLGLSPTAASTFLASRYLRPTAAGGDDDGDSSQPPLRRTPERLARDAADADITLSRALELHENTTMHMSMHHQSVLRSARRPGTAATEVADSQLGGPDLTTLSRALGLDGTDLGWSRRPGTAASRLHALAEASGPAPSPSRSAARPPRPTEQPPDSPVESSVPTSPVKATTNSSVSNRPAVPSPRPPRPASSPPGSPVTYNFTAGPSPGSAPRPPPPSRMHVPPGPRDESLSKRPRLEDSSSTSSADEEEEEEEYDEEEADEPDEEEEDDDDDENDEDNNSPIPVRTTTTTTTTTSTAATSDSFASLRQRLAERRAQIDRLINESVGRRARFAGDTSLSRTPPTTTTSTSTTTLSSPSGRAIPRRDSLLADVLSSQRQRAAQGGARIPEAVPESPVAANPDSPERSRASLGGHTSFEDSLDVMDAPDTSYRALPDPTMVLMGHGLSSRSLSAPEQERSLSPPQRAATGVVVVDVPRAVTVPECCVGGQVQVELPITNSSNDFVECRLRLAADEAPSSLPASLPVRAAFDVQSRLVLAPGATESAEIIFTPPVPGAYEGRLQLALRSLGRDGEDVGAGTGGGSGDDGESDAPQPGAATKAVQLSAKAALPKLQLEPAAAVLDFGTQLPGVPVEDKVVIINNGRQLCRVRVRLVEAAAAASATAGRAFHLLPPEDGPTSAAELDAAAAPELMLDIAAGGQRTVHVRFMHVFSVRRATASSSSHMAALQAELRVLSQDGQDLLLCHLRGQAGYARLQVPRSLQSLDFYGETLDGGEESSPPLRLPIVRKLPVRNAGNVLATVRVTVEDDFGCFTADPPLFALEPGQVSELSVTCHRHVDEGQAHVAGKGKKSRGVARLALLLEPHGPVYRLALRRSERDASTGVHVGVPVAAPASVSASDDRTSDWVHQQTQTQTQQVYSRASGAGKARRRGQGQARVEEGSDDGDNETDDERDGHPAREQGRASTAASPPPTLLCDRPTVGFGGVEVGAEASQVVNFRCPPQNQALIVTLAIESLPPAAAASGGRAPAGATAFSLGSELRNRQSNAAGHIHLQPDEILAVPLRFAPKNHQLAQALLVVQVGFARSGQMAVRLKVPLQGYGGCSRVEVVSRAVGGATTLDMGQIRVGKEKTMAVTLANRGTRAAYVLAVFADSELQKLPPDHARVQPEAFVLGPGREKTVHAAYVTTSADVRHIAELGRGAAARAGAGASAGAGAGTAGSDRHNMLATLNIFSGDEVLRQHLRLGLEANQRGRLVSPHHARMGAPVYTRFDFVTHFDNEELGASLEQGFPALLDGLVLGLHSAVDSFEQHITCTTLGLLANTRDRAGGKQSRAAPGDTNSGSQRTGRQPPRANKKPPVAWTVPLDGSGRGGLAEMEVELETAMAAADARYAAAHGKAAGGTQEPSPARSDTTVTIDPDRSWSATPAQIVIAGRRGEGCLHMTNYSSQPLSFSFRWPAHALDVVPSSGNIPARSHMVVKVHPRQAPLPVAPGAPGAPRSGPVMPPTLPWSGKLDVLCDNSRYAINVLVVADGADDRLDSDSVRGGVVLGGERRGFAIRVLDHEEREGTGGEGGGSEGGESGEESEDEGANSDDTFEAKDAAGVERSGAARGGFSPGRMRSAGGQGLEVGHPLQVEGGHVSLGEVALGQQGQATAVLVNKTAQSFTWQLQATASAYVQLPGKKAATGLHRAAYEAFVFRSSSGSIGPRQTQRLPVTFRPRDAGSFAQFWVLSYEETGRPQNRAEPMRGQFQVHVKGIGAGAAGPGAGAGQGRESARGAGGDTKVGRDGGGAAEGSKGRRKPQRGVYVKPPAISFSATGIGRTKSMTVKVCNESDKDEEVEFVCAGDGFLVHHPRVQLRPMSYVKLPIQYAPENDGPHEGLLVVHSSSGQGIKVPLRGHTIGLL